MRTTGPMPGVMQAEEGDYDVIGVDVADEELISTVIYI